MAVTVESMPPLMATKILPFLLIFRGKGRENGRKGRKVEGQKGD
jgi:hypothetical protein